MNVPETDPIKIYYFKLFKQTVRYKKIRYEADFFRNKL